MYEGFLYFLNDVFYKRKCENALFASAILWVSSFFFTAAPSPFAAAIISPASLSVMVFSPRLREYKIIHLIPKDTFLSGLTSVGTWKVAPPTRRLFTSTPGMILFNAFFQVSRPFSFVLFSTRSQAS